MSDRSPILSVKNLTTSFRTDRGLVTAVDDVSFDLYPGETLGIVGESGCGKTVTSKSILRLLPEHVTRYGKDSRIISNGKNLLRATEAEMQSVRGNKIAMIFQEPMTALNPVFTVGWQLDETLKYHTDLDRKGRKARSIEMLELVGIPNPSQRIREYAHQLSGGMRQRVMIAMALACEPDVLIADEPTTALDVTIQAQILQLMNELNERIGTATLLITHDLGVVAQVCDRVLVMYAGRVAESATADALFHRPRHPYTKALLSAVPTVEETQRERIILQGDVPSPANPPKGCNFCTRCPVAEARCRQEEPEWREVAPGRFAACHLLN